MRTYQEVRAALEVATVNSLTLAGVGLIHFDNVAHRQPGADETYAEIAISFSTVKQDVVGKCCGADDMRGTISVFLNTPANLGAGPGEDICQTILRGWVGIEGIGTSNFDGPRLVAADEGAVHQLFSVSCAFRPLVS